VQGETSPQAVVDRGLLAHQDVVSIGKDISVRAVEVHLAEINLLAQTSALEMSKIGVKIYSKP
jgi:hypothetical protein